jgi:hypothetical protein
MRSSKTCKGAEMKAYMYDPESGIYQGQVYEDGSLLKYIEGVTTIPPLPYADNEVLAFDGNEQKWIVRTIVEMRKILGIATK